MNFNTIAAVRKGIRVSSAESQTPITPIAIREFKARGPNGRGRISLSKDPAVSLQYAGELISAFIEKAGGSVNGKITTGAVPEGLKPVYIHKSRPLRRSSSNCSSPRTITSPTRCSWRSAARWADPSASRNR